MRPADLDAAISGLCSWREAGEQYAKRGGNVLPLDSYVQIALDELEWKGEFRSIWGPEKRPSRKALKWALDGIAANFDDDLLGDDLRTIHAALTEKVA